MSARDQQQLLAELQIDVDADLDGLDLACVSCADLQVLHARILSLSHTHAHIHTLTLSGQRCKVQSANGQSLVNQIISFLHFPMSINVAHSVCSPYIYLTPQTELARAQAECALAHAAVAANQSELKRCADELATVTEALADKDAALR